MLFRSAAIPYGVLVMTDNVPTSNDPLAVEIATGTHERTLAVPIQSVVIRTQSQLDRAARKNVKRAKPSAGLSADEDTVGRRDPEISGVLVAKDGVVRFVPVRTGLTSETMIEVMGALQAGDVVVSGPYKALRELKPGTKVKKEQPGGRPGK